MIPVVISPVWGEKAPKIVTICLTQELKDMKKNILLAIFAVFALASCQKDIIPEATDPVFKATIDASKTTINASTGVVSWVMGDEVSITDAASTTVIYVVSSIDGGSATLTKKSGETGTLGAGPYSASYGEGPLAFQTYSSSVPSLPMSAESNNTNFVFTVSCGLLELSVTQSGQSLKSIYVSNGTSTYILSCTTPESIESGKLFYIALPAGNYSSFAFTNSAGQVCRFNLKAGKSFAISANKITPLSFNSNLTNFKDEALSGEFSVAAGRKVRFARGNLQYQASTGTWRFAANQYDFIGNNAGNNTASDRDTQADWIDLFGWGATGQKNINNYLFYPYVTDNTDGHYKTIETANSTETLTRSNGGDWGICMGDDWRLLTKDELTYLLSTRGSSLRRNCMVEVTPGNNVHGLMVMPDGWGGTLVYEINNSTWNTLESAGAVFFPSAGYRAGTTITNSGTNGYYWSSGVASDKNGSGIFIKAGNDTGVIPNSSIPRSHGASVRLVVDVPSE